MYFQNNIGLFDDTGIKNTANVEDYPKSSMLWYQYPPSPPSSSTATLPRDTQPNSRGYDIHNFLYNIYTKALVLHLLHLWL